MPPHAPSTATDDRHHSWQQPCSLSPAITIASRAGRALATPTAVVVLARSENPPPSMSSVIEDILSPVRTVTGETPAELLRADMVYYDAPQGGAVFAASSITFCGSMWRNGLEGPVSQLLANVVARFAAGAPPLPSGSPR